MKVLMSAYACEPNRGSEPGVGWNWALQAARFHDVWVLTRANNREVIEAELARNPQPTLHFIYHDLPKWARWWKRGSRGVGLYSFLWDLSALYPARKAHRKLEFDLVHRLTMNSIETPGILWMLGRPYLWGPVGGAQVPPDVLRSYFGKDWINQRIRILRKRLLKYNPFVRLSARHASMVLAANADTERTLRELGVTRICRVLEAAVSPVDISSARRQDADKPPRVLWIGSLIPLKAPLLAVDALTEASARGVPAMMTMVGDGPLQSTVRQYASRMLATDKVDLVGQVSYTDIQTYFEKADAFLFTSLRDTSGNVVLEAMRMGVPVIALNHHGAAEMLTDETGILIPIKYPEQVVSDLADAILTLHRNPQLAHRLGAAGRERVRTHFSWERKGEIIREIYATICNT